MILKSVILQKKNLLRIDFSSQKLTFYPLIYPMSLKEAYTFYSDLVTDCFIFIQSF